jgi:hypothetical protein
MDLSIDDIEISDLKTMTTSKWLVEIHTDLSQKLDQIVEIIY